MFAERRGGGRAPSDRGGAGGLGGAGEEGGGGADAARGGAEGQAGPGQAHGPAVAVIHVAWQAVDEGRGPGEVVGHAGRIRAQRDGAEDTWVWRYTHWLATQIQFGVHTLTATHTQTHRSLLIDLIYM